LYRGLETENWGSVAKGVFEAGESGGGKIKSLYRVEGEQRGIKTKPSDTPFCKQSREKKQEGFKPMVGRNA